MKPETTGTERAWLSYSESAAYTGYHRVTLYRALKQNALQAGGTDRAVRFEKTELDRWMRAGGRGEGQ